MEKKRCEHCGSSLIQRWKRITAGQVYFLVKFRELVIRNNKNLICVSREMNLDNVEYSDFQKLRYHALIAKYRENGILKRGWWVLTRRGNKFMTGDIKIPEKVRVFRNRITGYSENLVSFEQVYDKQPYWESKEDIIFEPVTHEILDESMAITIKNEIKKKGKKGQINCEKCGVIMKKTFDTIPSKINPGSVIINFYLKCPACGHTESIK